MKKQPTSAKGTNPKSNYSKFGFLIILILVIGYFLWWFMYNETLFVANKPDTEQRTQQALDATVGIGEPVYQSFQDDGCKESAQGWLGRSTGCGYAGQRYFRASGDASRNIVVVEERLRSLGFTTTNDVSADQLMSSKGGASKVYTSKQNVVVFLYFFANDPQRPKLSARSYLQLPNDIPLSADDYIFGVSAKGSYYSCSVTSWIHAPCPTPPSAPVRNS